MLTYSVYIAVSLDGFIATNDQGVNWLDQYNGLFEAHPESYFAKRYESYYNSIDSVIIGYNTYASIMRLTDDYPYKDKRNYLITRNQRNFPYGEIKNYEDLAAMKKTGVGKVWIVGGGQLISAMLADDMIDELILTVMPVTLGSGVRLFTDNQEEHLQRFQLKNVTNDLGIVEMTYEREQ